MAKNKTRLQKSTHVLNNSKILEWCYVNTDNEFRFLGTTLVIDDSVEEYKVYNKAGTVDDYTNDAYMEEILVSIDCDDNFNFYNQNYDLINSSLIRVKG